MLCQNIESAWKSSKLGEAQNLEHFSVPKDDKNGLPHTGRNFSVIRHVFLLLMYYISKCGQLHAELVVDIGAKG